MMTRFAVALIVLTACGGGVATGSKPASPAAPSAAEADAPPGADRLCACADEACAQPFLTQLTAQQMAAPGPAPAQDAEYDRAVACYRGKWKNDNGMLMLKGMPGLVDEACACPDPTCFAGAEERLLTWLKLLSGNALLDSKEIVVVKKERDRFKECAYRLAPESPMVGVYKRVADEMCACADVDCAAAAAHRGNAEIEPHKQAHTKISQRDADAIRRDIARASACMDKLGGTPGK